MNTRTTRLLLLLAACATVNACGNPDDLETDSQALRNLKKVMTRVPVNGREGMIRYVEIKCPGGEADCASPDEILLLADENATTPFPAVALGAYVGCGPQAVSNVLSYVTGQSVNVANTARYVGTIDFPGAAIGSTPGQVGRGLRAALETNSHRYGIWQDSGPGTATDWIPGRSEGPELRDIKDHLKLGYPLILLVDGGNHWVVATGYRAPDRMHVTDYLGQDRWVSFQDLQFDHLKKAPKSALGVDGYNKRSYIGIAGITNYEMMNNHNPTGETPNPPPTGSTCDENIRCSGFKQLNPDNCACMCPEAWRTTCANQGSVYTFNEGSCTCDRDPDAPVTSF